MKLIRNLGVRLDENGRKQSWGEFLCLIPNCNKIVERFLGNGKRNKSCGCAKNILISKANKDKKHSKETKQKIGQANKGLKRTEEQNKRNSESHKGENNPFYGKEHTSKSKQKISISNKGKNRTEEQNRKQSKRMKGENNPNYGIHKYGENSPNWQGGGSFEPYSPKFNKELKQSILERDNYTCQDPNCEHKMSKLDIHHIDYDKKNNNPKNLITLCRSCHAKTFGKNNREYWIKFYQNIQLTNEKN